jgi:hypothetical protein
MRLAQGKTLDTPERVPFRLTHNLVNGLGVTGVEGGQSLVPSDRTHGFCRRFPHRSRGYHATSA